MSKNHTLNFLNQMLQSMPEDWLKLTTHRLDIYNESLAKTEFLAQLEQLNSTNKLTQETIAKLPTAYDYIRLGHPLSCVLEWTLGALSALPANSVISFSSQVTPILAVLRKNLFLQKATRIYHFDDLPVIFHSDVLQRVYGYSFEVLKINELEEIQAFDGSTILVENVNQLGATNTVDVFDFSLQNLDKRGSVLFVKDAKNSHYISEIQHVRRRETIAMTPANCLAALQQIVGDNVSSQNSTADSKAAVTKIVHDITATQGIVAIGSSGLSVQYAIMMGLIDYALAHYPGKAIKFLVPPNCYGGTNDQARRVAACVPNVEILDLPVDGENNMVQSIEHVLEQVAQADAIPFIIAEIPTNPRVEVPDMHALRAALTKVRLTDSGSTAIAPVFILDQTFCPNIQFLAETAVLREVATISYVSGSKFPSGGKCTAGYCVGNQQAEKLMPKIEQHLVLCDNEASDFQLEILAEQMPSMLDRIQRAYENTRNFVAFIEATLPQAKINFVSEALAKESFTPSVFSLDLPTIGETAEQRESYKRALNDKLIEMMISKIPHDSKYCVSYGQLKGCYWTIPATSTQGTTKEDDKDYIARVAIAPDIDLELHKKVFEEFVNSIH